MYFLGFLRGVQIKWGSLLVVLLAIGLFIQISGKVWIASGSARNSQVYIWLLLPVLICLVSHVIARKKIVFPVCYLPWFVFLAWVALSSAWATGAEVSSISLAKRAGYITLYIVGVFLLYARSEKILRASLRGAFIVVAVGALASIVYQFGVLDRPLAYRAFRIDSLGWGKFADYGWPVAAGIFHGSIASWVLGFALDRRASFKAFLFWLCVFAVLAFYMLLTYARGAWIALVLASLLSVVFHNTRRGWYLVGTGALILAFGAFIFWHEIIYEISERKLTGREAIWEYYLNVMNGHWAFGHGLGTPFKYAWSNGWAISPHAHSLYLQQVYDSGLVALALLILGVVSVIFFSWKVRENEWIKLAVPALLFALVSMLTDVERIFTRPGDYWTVFWLPVALLLAVPTKMKLVGNDPR